ncbi:MAG: NAD(+)/NADH kinase [Actinobacteria bacterium]|nr:NAD(+)/NADH kinase [Actinomycetota bacterium]MCL6105409.1 NAD(+)/NADH kinase [Actinomycetota bacterium]
MVKIAFVVYPKRVKALELADEAQQWVVDNGNESAGVFQIDRSGSHVDAKALGNLDLLVSLGGDGTMLQAVHLGVDLNVPVLGVNLGRLGYLTEIEPSGLKDALSRFFKGDYRLEQRMVLSVTNKSHKPGHNSSKLIALNEVVLEKSLPGHTVRIKVKINNKSFMDYVADGLIVCTPTGSTAYNFSARGPVISPKLKVLVLTTVAPHNMFDRSLVLEPADHIELEVAGASSASWAVDGRSMGELLREESLLITSSDTPIQLVAFEERDFQMVLKSKFTISDSTRTADMDDTGQIGDILAQKFPLREVPLDGDIMHEDGE